MHYEADVNEADLEALRRVIACGTPERNAQVLREIVDVMWNRYLRFEALRRRKAGQGVLLDPMEPLHSLFRDPLTYLARDARLHRLLHHDDPDLENQYGAYKALRAVTAANPGISLMAAATSVAAARHPEAKGDDLAKHANRYLDAHAKFRGRVQALEPYAFLFHTLVMPDDAAPMTGKPSSAGQAAAQ